MNAAGKSSQQEGALQRAQQETVKALQDQNKQLISKTRELEDDKRDLELQLAKARRDWADLQESRGKDDSGTRGGITPEQCARLIEDVHKQHREEIQKQTKEIARLGGLLIEAQVKSDSFKNLCVDLEGKLASLEKIKAWEWER